MPALLAAVLLLLSAITASAQVYKCSSGNKTVYSDSPCTSGNAKTLTEIQPNTIGDPTAPSDLALEHRLDAAVKAAIADNDFIRAQALATTQQQRDWIAAARKESDSNAVANRTEAVISAEKASSAECLQAKRSLEQAANSYVRTEILDVKTRLMRESCGTADTPDYVYGGDVVPVLVYPYRYRHHHHSVPPPLVAPPPERGKPILSDDRFITRPNGPYGPVKPLGPTN